MKIKIAIISVCSFLLILLALSNNNFYKPTSSIRWRKLTWEDFKGIPVLFTGWGARISSNIFTEYDSTFNRYHAYSSMNNNESWKKLSFEGSSYTLRHEQYHFNLTESFARLLNTRIAEDSLTHEELSEELSELRKELKRLQKLYDEESDHSLQRDMQRYWEYKIDSMMLLNEGNSGVVKDYLTGVSIFFPKEVNVYSTNSSGFSYRLFGYTSIYDMSISVFSRRSFESPEDLREKFVQHYERDSLSIISSIENENGQYSYDILFEAVNADSTKFYTDRWIRHYGFLHAVRMIHPIKKNVLGYQKIRNSILNSFEIIDSKNYWIGKHKKSDGFYIEEITSDRVSKEEYGNIDCWVYRYSDDLEFGIYSQLIEIDNGYILPYDPSYVQDSLIQDVMLIANEEIQIFEKSELFEDFFFIPKTEADILNLKLGYTLKEDTSEVCFQFYNDGVGFVLNDEVLDDN